jgi:hypothetical protein
VLGKEIFVFILGHVLFVMIWNIQCGKIMSPLLFVDNRLDRYVSKGTVNFI